MMEKKQKVLPSLQRKQTTGDEANEGEDKVNEDGNEDKESASEKLSK